MPQEYKEYGEIVRRRIDAWNRRDIATLLKGTDPEVEYINSPTAVEPGTRRGREALEGVFRTQWEMLSDARWEIDRLYERGEEVLVLGRISRRLAESETRIEERILVSSSFENGQVTRIEVLGFGRAEVKGAIEAAGLSE